MFSERREEGFFKSVEEVILADNMVETIDETSKTLTLDAKDKRIFGQAIRLLELAKKGMVHTKTLELDEHATKSCSAYGRTLRALDHLARKSPSTRTQGESSIDIFFSKAITLLTETKKTGNLQMSGKKDEWVLMRTFFEALRETLLEENIQIPEDVLVERGLGWREFYPRESKT